MNSWIETLVEKRPRLKRRYIIPVVAFIAILIFFAPLIAAWFPGMHRYIKPADYGDGYEFCARCHPMEYMELRAGLPDAPHAGKSCNFCHLITPQAGEGHAAKTMACMDIYCHGDTAAWPDIRGDITDDYAAHEEFYSGALNATIHKDANEACLACHTEIEFEMVQPMNETLVYNVANNTFCVNVTEQ